jgi:hypothetical protein
MGSQQVPGTFSRRMQTQILNRKVPSLYEKPSSPLKKTSLTAAPIIRWRRYLPPWWPLYRRQLIRNGDEVYTIVIE